MKRRHEKFELATQKILEDRGRRTFLTYLLVISILLFGISSVWFYKEFNSEWMQYQKKFELVSKDVLGDIRQKRPIKIEQIILNTLNKVDRCPTCHLGIENDKFKTVEQPFKSHSGKYLVWHPVENIGCTICHKGNGRATNYKDAAHNKLPQGKKTMIPTELTRVSCGKCHLDKAVPDASLLSDGRELLERYGCYGCHIVQRYSDEIKPSLSLDGLGDKVNKEWLIKWLNNPADYFKEEKMPAFDLSQDEIMALTEFLLSSRDKDRINTIEGEGDYDKGRGLFRQSRCISCHSINGRGGVLASELGNVANKVKKKWILRYLKDVHHYQPRIKMLQYHFTDQNILDIAEYMMEEFYSEDDETEEWDAAGEDDDIEEEVADGLDSESKETAVSEDKRQELISKGRSLYINYGCYDCHDLSGIGTQPKVGPDLMTIGSKIEKDLYFGDLKDVERSIENYVFLKIKAPDLFNGKAKMPQYHLSDEELIKITIALLSFTNEEIPLEYIVREERHIKFNPHGQFGFLFRNYRCFSCHEVFGEGGELSTAPIDIYGSQLKKDWLFNYLKKPYAVRPSVTPRMPRFRMTDQEAQYMTDYIIAVFTDDSIPEDFEKQFLPGDIGRGKELFKENGCIACHIIGKGGGYIGPQLNTVGDRLKPGWIFKWLMNPQLYKTDTISPNFGLSEDEARALTAYLSSMKQAED